MTWALLAVPVVVFVVARLARRRRDCFNVSPSEPISTMHMSMARKQTQKTKAALDAATQVLR